MTLRCIRRQPLQAFSGKTRRISVGIALGHLRQGGARFGVVLEFVLRKAELEEGVGGLAGVRPTFAYCAKGNRRVVVIARYVVGLAQPILGIICKVAARVAREILFEGRD